MPEEKNCMNCKHLDSTPDDDPNPCEACMAGKDYPTIQIKWEADE